MNAFMNVSSHEDVVPHKDNTQESAVSGAGEREANHVFRYRRDHVNTAWFPGGKDHTSVYLTSVQ